MADYFPTSPLYWTETSRSWPERARLLGAWLQTCEHRNLEGLYRLPFGYITSDLGFLPRDVEKHMTTLIEERFAEYDREREMVLVPACLRLHQPKSDRQVIGAMRVLKRLPHSPLLQRLYELALSPTEEGKREPLAPKLAAAMAAEFGFGTGDRSDTHSHTHSDRDSETHSDTDSDTHSDTHSDGVAVPTRNTRAPAPEPEPEPEVEQPPQPPTGGRKRDHDRFTLQVKEWCQRQRPSSEEEERWASARAVLVERFGAGNVDAVLGNAHAHRSPNGRLVIALEPSRREGLPQLQTYVRSLKDAINGPYDLIDCPCPRPVEAAA